MTTQILVTQVNDEIQPFITGPFFWSLVDFQPFHSIMFVSLQIPVGYDVGHGYSRMALSIGSKPHFKQTHCLCLLGCLPPSLRRN